MFMSGKDFRESLRAYKPSVYVNGRKVRSVAGDPDLAPGINAIGVTYDYALRPALAPLMRAQQHTSGREVNRLIHVSGTSADLLNKLEAVRLEMVPLPRPSDARRKTGPAAGKPVKK